MYVCAQLLNRVKFLQPHGLKPTRFLCPWGFSGNTEVGCHFFLQTKGWNTSLLHCMQILYRWAIREDTLCLYLSLNRAKFRISTSFLACLFADAHRLRRIAQKHGREELPLAQGQGRQPSARLHRHRSSQEELLHVWGQGQRPRGATLCPRSGAAAEMSYPTSEVRRSGQDGLPHVRGQGQRPRGATPHLRSGAAAKTSYTRP